MTGVKNSSHLSYSYNHEEMIKSFFSLHKEKLDHKAWQMASYPEDLSPIFNDKKSFQIILNRDGRAFGLSDSIANLLKNSVENSKIKSVFGSNSVYGILLDNGSCICHLCRQDFEEYVGKCYDLHALGWGISAIGIDRKSLFHINVVTSAKTYLSMEEEFKFCFCLGSTIGKAVAFALTERKLYRLLKISESEIEAILENDFGEDASLKLICRSNNLAIFGLGEKTLVLDGEESFVLDTKVERCYISQRCCALFTTHGWILRSMAGADTPNICQTMKEKFGWHFKNSSKCCMTMQVMVDPLLAFNLGIEDLVKEHSGWICSYRKSFLRNKALAEVLERTPSYSLLRMCNNDYGK